MPRKKMDRLLEMNNEKQAQNLYIKLDKYEMTEAQHVVLNYLRDTFPVVAEKFHNTRKEKNVPISEQWELAFLLTLACEAVYDRDVSRAGLRRLTMENEKLRQIRLS